MKFSFSEEAKKAESGTFKFKEGNNVMRIVSEFIYRESIFKDKKTGAEKKSRKFVGFIIDRVDGTVKPVFFPRTIIDQISSLQETEDYGFEEVPMPYDINISTTNAGIIEAVYKVIPARANSSITPTELAAIKAAGSITDFIASLDRPNEETPKDDGVQQFQQEALDTLNQKEPPDFLK